MSLIGQTLLMGIVQKPAINLESKQHVKGVHTGRRDIALACRFYYWSTLEKRNFQFCLEQLCKEFFITEYVVVQRLKTKQDYIKELAVKNTSRRQLRKIYDHLQWF